MEDYEIKRAAVRLIQKYGKKALPKSVEVIRFYLEEGDDNNAKRWVSIGYEVKRQMKVESVKDILSKEKELFHPEEA